MRESLTEEVDGVAVCARRLEAGVVRSKVCSNEEDIVIEEDVSSLGVDGFGKRLYMCRGYQGEDRAGECFGLTLAVGDKVGDEDGIVDGEGYIACEDLVVVSEWCWAQGAYAIAVEDFEDALHLVAYIGFGGEDPSAHGFVALGVVGLFKGRDGTQAVGKPEDDSSQTSRLVSDVGDDPFHRNMCLVGDGAECQRTFL